MPLTTSRLAKAAAAISFASVPLVGLSGPALASPAGSASLAISGISARSASPADTSPSYEWWLRTLHVVRAWDWGSGTGVTVAVLSDGVATGQRYLAGSVTSGPDFTHSGRSASSRYFGVMGTSLASLIAGHGTGSFGHGDARAVDGVAPGVKVLSVRVTLSPGDPLWSDGKLTRRLPDAIAAGIRYSVAHGAKVIELPADPGVRDAAITSGSRAAAGGSAAERAAVRAALAKNVVLVAPAGDNGQAGDARNYPAAYPGVIAVGAFDRGFNKAPYSSKQPYVTLTAAGQGVVAASKAGFRSLNSTCASSALVAGIVALIRAEFPDLTVAQVRKSMTRSTVYRPHGGMRDGSGYGTVDAARALTSASTLAPPHARPAMLGAKPRTRPVAPPVQSATSLIMHQLTGDAAVSGAALALLLIPIALYGLMARRRERQDAALVAAQASQQVPGRPGHGTMLADPLLEFFGPQHARPASPSAPARSAAAPRFQPRPGLTGRSTMSAALGARSAASQSGPMNGQGAPDNFASPPVTQVQPTALGRGSGTSARPAPIRGFAASPAASPAVGSSAAGSPGSDRPAVQPPGVQPPGVQPSSVLPVRQPTAGGAGSDSTVRRAQVTGTPPWEPAMQPTSELPWAVIAPPTVGNRPTGTDAPAIPPPPDSVWDSAPVSRSAPPGSLFTPAPVDPGTAFAEPGVQPARRTDQPSGSRRSGRSAAGRSASGRSASGRSAAGRRADDRAEIERGPIFSWNAAPDVTEQFTAVDPASTDWSKATGQHGRE